VSFQSDSSWEFIKTLKYGAETSALPWPLKKLGSALFQIDQTSYVVTEIVGNGVETKILRKMWWVASDADFQCFILRKQAFENTPPSVPPMELLPASVKPVFADLLHHAKTGVLDHSVRMWSARGDVFSQPYCGQSIAVGRFDYFFRLGADEEIEMRDWAAAPVCAVAYHFSDDRWRKLGPLVRPLAC
jgi:hypothetical protein